MGASLLPAHSGGLLPALYLWRRLAVEGLGRFGDVYYYGTAPLPGHEGLVDVLVGSHKGVECRFYFDPADGHLLAMEMFPDEDADPCEVYFSDYREVDGRVLAGPDGSPLRRRAASPRSRSRSARRRSENGVRQD